MLSVYLHPWTLLNRIPGSSIYTNNSNNEDSDDDDDDDDGSVKCIFAFIWKSSTSLSYEDADKITNVTREEEEEEEGNAYAAQKRNNENNKKMAVVKVYMSNEISHGCI
eukprot:4370540-Ditylum_brightwellii.AAC.1